jgi:hypothetical protein
MRTANTATVTRNGDRFIVTFTTNDGDIAGVREFDNALQALAFADTIAAPGVVTVGKGVLS